MKNILFPILFCISLSFSHGQKVYEVYNAEEFLASLKPDSEIKLKSKCIIVSDLKPVVTDYYVITEDTVGKSHITIKNISDLKISGESFKDSYIVSATEYQSVLSFEECSNISIQNILFAHGPNKGTMCTGAALAFSQCESILIDSCYLFGSGSYGILTAKYPEQKFGAKKLTITNSIISSCTYGIMDIADASDVAFNNCSFIDNKGGVYISDSEKILFLNCNFSFNYNMPEVSSTKDGKFLSYLINIRNSEKINFADCTITNNTFGFLANDTKLSEGLMESVFINNFFRHGNSYKD